MPTDKDTTYEVGYGKPPRRTQFKKGESGNPKGRPKGSPNLATTWEKERNERVVVNLNGRRKKITQQEAVVKRTFHGALSGDHRATKLTLDELHLAESWAEATAARMLREQPPQLSTTTPAAVTREVLWILMESGEFGPAIAQAAADELKRLRDEDDKGDV